MALKLKRRFYVGHPGILASARDEICPANPGSAYPKESLAEAVELAKTRAASTGEDQIVVQIVRVVRRTTPPVAVLRVE